MRKKLLLVLVVTLLAIATVAVFAACNDSIQNGDGASGNSPVIDIPFVPVTEGTEGLVYTLFDENSWAAKDGIDISGYWVTGYTGDETDVVIPNMHEGKRVIGVTEGAFLSNTLITSVNISNGIKYLDIAGIAELGAVFFDCTNLKSVTLPQSLANIDAFIFENCPSITSVTIPANVSEITMNPFINCENLTEVKVSKDNGNYYSDGNYLYEKKTNKIISAFNVGSSVTIPDSVTSIGDWAFYNCTSLTSVTIPDRVTSIGDSAFSWCTSLTSVTIPDSVTSIGYDAFDDTPYYKNLPDGEVYLGKVLYKYKGNMPANYTANVKDGTVSISDRAFSYCNSLTSVTIPDGVTSIGDYAFFNCASLTSVIIGDSVTSIGESAFGSCESLKSLNVDSNNGTYYSEGNCIIEKKTKKLIVGCNASVIPDGTVSIGDDAFSDCYSLTSVTIPDSVTSIGDYAFSDCYWLTSVTIGDGVTSIGDYAFGDCTSLTSVTIGDGVTSIGDWAFSGCTSLTSVTIPDSVTSIGEYAFAGCTSLTSVTIPDSVTSIGDWAFGDCTSLTSVTIGDGVTSIGDNAFYWCTSLTSVTIPDSVTSIGSGAFYYCDSLTSITIPDSVTSIGSSAFSNCDSLTSVTIPDSVMSIGDSAFSGCESLETITVDSGNSVYHSAGNCLIETATKTLIAGCKNSVIPDDGSVTSIGDWAFSECTSLTSVTIPDSVTSIGDYAFAYCDSLTSVTFEGTVAQWNAISKGSDWNHSTPFSEVICSDGTVSVG